MAKSARWEIRLHEQPPMIVRVAAERDLAAEWNAFHKGRKKPPASWKITDGCAVLIGLVLGVQRLTARRSSPAARQVGFKVDGDAR